MLAVNLEPFSVFCVPEKRKMGREDQEMEKRGRMTRATKTLLAQQHQLIDVDKALEFLAKKTPQLVVNHDSIKVNSLTLGTCPAMQAYRLICVPVWADS